jgi:hypothetical protein
VLADGVTVIVYGDTEDVPITTLFVTSFKVMVIGLGVPITTLSSPQLSVLAEVHTGMIQRNWVLAVWAAAGIGTTILFQLFVS